MKDSSRWSTSLSSGSGSWGSNENHGFAHVEGAQRSVDGTVAHCVRDFGGVEGGDVVALGGVNKRQVHSGYPFRVLGRRALLPVQLIYYDYIRANKNVRYVSA